VDVLSSYFTAPFALASGQMQPVPIIATVGILCLIAGLILCIRWREKRAVWMLALIVCAALTTAVIELAQSVLGWLGIGFVIAVGAIMLPILTHLVAQDASRRLPVWLIGVFAYSLFACLAWLPLMTILGVAPV
jgi:predicted membrane channel-forming protein YqfA (hemolysin III family)